MTQGFDIELSHCRKTYGDIDVLDDVSLQVKNGEFITVLGPSGCGKTTTLRVIGGFIIPDNGRVSIRGREVTNLPPYKRNIGVVFQNYALWPHMTVSEILSFGLRIRKLPREEIARRVDEALSMVQLTGLKDRYPRELSGGQQQRVAMARALAIDPEVIILDEPLSNLDRRLREELRIELKRLQRSLGVTMLFVTHDQEEALSMSDQVVVMQSGRIQQIADPRTVYERPANRFVAGFLGSANFLAGELVQNSRESRAEIKLGNGAVVTAHAPSVKQVGEKVTVIVRPEWLVLERQGSGLPTNQLEGTVGDVIYEGSAIRYGIKLTHEPESPIFLQERSNADVLKPGDKVRINVTNAVIATE
ncbi:MULTISPECIES: ABC transporter ATP-binding protein [unclassified Neorhizobium]|uniref:ABC transporter ATP-binding protein n=1 Tax=unclassified Neorhizobium TaxID=2629175 RepID=UPI001FF16FF8|nr:MULTISPECIES: ABC transporter ATP-binding protein [unclassified Neorhizobium]MCJ9670371.1 ABC transporter ATP-binding protein [Neorhizobium sp. SHOUNA12B]MCJ9746315.1 ABC transporter ATP-binding protein [Neorhizobium sp. SHOUNA12A]